MNHRIVFLGALAAFNVSCGKATCDTGDFGCLVQHASFSLNGQSITLTPVPSTMVKAVAPSNMSGMMPGQNSIPISIIPLSAPNFGDPIQMIEAGRVALPGGSGAGVPAPSITSMPMNLHFTPDQPMQTLSIGYDDPYGMTPPFILLPNILVPGISTPQAWATPPLRDLRATGVASIQINFTNVTMTPVSQSNVRPTVVTPTAVMPQPINPSDVHPTPVTGTPVVSWFDPPLTPANNNGGGGVNGTCMTSPVNCNGTSHFPRCSQNQQCCDLNGNCTVCATACGNGGFEQQCTNFNCINAVNAVIDYCCPNN